MLASRQHFTAMAALDAGFGLMIFDDTVIRNLISLADSRPPPLSRDWHWIKEVSVGLPLTLSCWGGVKLHEPV